MKRLVVSFLCYKRHIMKYLPQIDISKFVSKQSRGRKKSQAGQIKQIVHEFKLSDWYVWFMILISLYCTFSLAMS